MNNKPTLSIQVNEDIQLRLLEERHVEQYFALISRNQEYLQEWIAVEAYEGSVEALRSYVKQLLLQFVQKTPTPVASLSLSRRFPASCANQYAESITTWEYLWPQRRINNMSYPNQGSQGHLAPKRIRYLLLILLIVTLLTEFLSGNMDRSLVEMPAWQHVGALAWATFSHYADLGPGLLIYPVEGIGSTVLCLTIAFIVFLKRRSLGRAVVLPISLAVLFVLGGILTTTQAAPAMLSTASHMSNPAALSQALNTFTFWNGIRSVCGWLESAALLWALVAVASSSSTSRLSDPR